MTPQFPASNERASSGLPPTPSQSQLSHISPSPEPLTTFSTKPSPWRLFLFLMRVEKGPAHFPPLLTASSFTLGPLFFFSKGANEKTEELANLIEKRPVFFQNNIAYAKTMFLLCVRLYTTLAEYFGFFPSARVPVCQHKQIWDQLVSRGCKLKCCGTLQVWAEWIEGRSEKRLSKYLNGQVWSRPKTTTTTSHLRQNGLPI